MFSKKLTDEIEYKTLSSCPLFAGLSKGELKTVLGMSHIRDYSFDEKVFTESTVGLCFYIVVKGKVDIVSETSQDGSQHKTIKTYGAGAYFSEAHLFAEINHSVSCIAREVTKLIIFTKPDFDDFVKINPKTGNKLLLNFLQFLSEQLELLYKQNLELLQQKNPEAI
jgi:CRP/FNR family cyclic AMP-dependent transcriptional regulator